MTNIRQGVSYGDAETRGKLRMWKKKLAQNYTIFNNFFLQLQGGKLLFLVEDMLKSARSGRKKAFDKIHHGFGPGVTLESVDLTNRGRCLAVWSILKPRDAVTQETVDNISESQRESLMQDCVTVNYVVVGTRFGLVSEGLWTLEIPDHALGRAVERSRLLQPETIIREAHKNLLDLPMTVLGETFKGRDSPATFFKAGAGCFAGHFCLSEDVSMVNNRLFADDMPLTAMVRVNTWLNEKQLFEDQIVLSEKGEPGQRLGDNWLKPRQLVVFQRSGDQIAVGVWSDDQEKD